MNCPMCNSKMVVRRAKKGKYIGNLFYGCSRFPECKMIIDIPDVSVKVNVGDIVEFKSNLTSEITGYKIIRNTYESKIVSQWRDDTVIKEELIDMGDPIAKTISENSLFGQKLLGAKIGDVLSIDNEEKEVVEVISIYKKIN